MIPSSISLYASAAIALLALFVWGGVGYFAWTISIEAEAHRSTIAGMEQKTAENAFSLRLHALARETKNERSRLEEISRTDLAGILDGIERLSKDSGIPMEITQAPSISRMESSTMRVLSLSVEALGTFAQVARAVALLETIPIPSTVDELRFERTAGAEGAARSSWRMIASVRFLTTADIPTL